MRPFSSLPGMDNAFQTVHAYAATIAFSDGAFCAV